MPHMRGGKAKRRHTAAWRTFLLGGVIVAALFAFNLRHPKILEFAELKANDLRMYARPGRKPVGAIAIAAVDDKSIAELGRWPWPRSVMAQLVDSLGYYKVKVIGFDVIFSEIDNADAERAVLTQRLKRTGIPQSKILGALGPSNDGAFADAIHAQGATILGYPFANHRMTKSAVDGQDRGFLTKTQTPPPLAYGMVLKAQGPPPTILTAAAYRPPIPILLTASKSTAFVDIDSDMDGVMRSELTVIRFNGRYCVPMFLAAASAYRDNAPLALSLSSAGVLHVALGNERIPVDEMGRMLVDFRGGAGTFPHYSAADIIAHRVAPSALAGKIVLVGVTGHGLGDRVVTPVGANYAAVQIHANAIDDVLAGTFVRRSKVSAGEERAAAVVLGLGVSLAAGFLSALWSAGIAILLFAGYFIYAQVRLTEGVLIGIVFPLVTVVITYALLASYRYATEGVEKRRLRHAFEHYLHPDVIASVVDEPRGLHLGGERRHLSILFCDIVNFTARAERSEPEALVAMLNTYMTVMTDLILKGGGVVDKLMGDGIMAFWGAPLAVENPARAAIDCALNMLEELTRLRRGDSRFRDVDVGIGIATGDVIVGNIGGERRFDYSVIGDTVNLASRLEGLTRRFGVHLITTRKTLAEAGVDYLVREIGLVKVKGKEEEVAVAEIAGRLGGGDDARFYERFAGAVGMIRGGSNSDATVALDALLSEQPEDRLIGLLIEKLHAGEVRPSGDIVFEFQTK
ncbi:MAG: CHASE2 domain-containing protein [Candidatus Binataceae bacterium]